MTLIYAENALPMVRRLGYRETYRRWAADRGFLFGENPAGEAVAARVEHGRWLADCPVCLGAENVTGEDHVFFCCSCGNEANDGNLRPVEFPHQRQAIDVLLSRRPRQNQNWNPGETVDDLAAENASHGLGEE